MNQKSFFFTILLLFTLGLTSIAQPISGIVNHYARVMSFDSCDMSFTLTDATNFRVGTRILLIQMNGARTQSGNNASFGNVDALNNVGKYEVNAIDSVSNQMIFLRYYLKNQYDDNATLQIITFPNYDDAIVTDTLRAKPWNGETGGIIAFEALTLTLNAPIDASAVGFRGGSIKAYTNCDALQNYSDYFYALSSTDKTNGAPKGEGISEIMTGKECGRGAQANGGGGGNNHKAGGGGGGHVVAGGMGGEQKHVNDVRNCVGKFPGFDGKAITGLGNSRFIFGGGGGAGHNKDGLNSRGGNGGGIVFIKTNSLTSNGKKIAANGGDGSSNVGDGAGGGGAGGTILLLSTAHNGTVNLEATGGNGGNSGSFGEYDFGPGGGGAGGRILTQTTTAVTSRLVGGAFGKNDTRRDGIGAVKGNDGVATNVPTFTLLAGEDTVKRSVIIAEQPKTVKICEYQTTILTVRARGVKLNYEWQIRRTDGQGFVPLLGDTTFIGVNTPTLILNRVRTSLNPYLFRCVVKSECSSVRPANTDTISLTIVPAPIAAFTPNITYNTVSFTNGSSNALSYSWDFGNGQSSTLQNPTYTYPVQGEYKVILRATNNCASSFDTLVLKINALPKASFTANTNDYCTPANVRFTNTSTNNTVTNQWLFPGGSPESSTDANPSVIYTTAGIYDAVLIAINGNGRDTLRRTNYIRVNAAPTISFSILRAPSSTTVTFVNRTAGASGYLWNFGDGTTSTESAPQHVYRSTGVFVVCLTASNACGLSSLCDTLALLSLPSALISVNQADGCTPHAVQYSGQNPTNVTSWLWTFPGGTPSTSTERNPRVLYATSGLYGVTLRVSNTAGINTTTLDNFIRVLPSPVAKFSVTNVHLATVTFQNESSSAITYRWDFGDGTGSLDFNPPAHTYYRNGDYTVTLQALNNVCGAVTSQKVPIFVVGTENTEGGHLSIFPNPTSGKVTLDFKTPLSAAITLAVSNARGQVLKTVQLSAESSQELDFSDLARGVYFLRFTSERGNFVKKMIKI